MQRREFLLGMMSATAALAVTRTAVAQPTPAGAIPTPVYLDMATRGGLFLENTARDAFGKSDTPRVKRFARAEVVEQVNLANRIDAATGGAPAMAGRRRGRAAWSAAWWPRPSRWRAPPRGRRPAWWAACSARRAR
jgi:hypothetical protein